MKEKTERISQAFQRWLFILVVIAFLATTAFLWFFQTKLSENNAISLLTLNISDVKQDILDASNENLLSLTQQIAAELEKAESIDSALLSRQARRYQVTEINYINPEGIITASTYPNFIGHDMSSGRQSAEFLVLLGEQAEYIQNYQPISYDTSLSRKYGGVSLACGGFVQVGYDAERFQKDIDKQVIGVTRNRHVGEGGCLIIADETWKIVSDRNGNEGKNLDVTGISVNLDAISNGESFTATVYGEPCYCIYKASEGYHILAVIPQNEAALSRNVSVGVTVIMEIVVFAALFVMIYVLVKKLVVDNIGHINRSLSQITNGDLETVVNVRSHQEFAALSDDINATVDTLKRYIADAAARIDAELALAKNIQCSALPSVFPPYPNRKEFDIWASMDTAKEVGGDFYDFYFVNKDTLAFLVADVSDKGIPAAMFMMTAKTLLKGYAESGMAIDEIFTLTNEKLCENNDADMFVTAWMGFLDTRNGTVTYANAGHNPPLIRHGHGDFSYLKTQPNFVLAGMEGMCYECHKVKLEPGDKIYLYTDGVTEAANKQQELFGEERLQHLLNQHKELTPSEILDAVKAELDRFTSDAPQADDITMLCLEYRNGIGI